MAKFYAKAPDGSDATLSITVSGFTQSLQQNGWCKMPNGLILQWFEDFGNNTNELNIINILNPIYLSLIKLMGNIKIHIY